MTHAEALLWLNDHRGYSVTVTVGILHGDEMSFVLEARGELEHWTAESGSARELVGSPVREDLRGLYSVGGAQLDVTELAWSRITPGGLGDSLLFELEDGARLLIVGDDGIEDVRPPA
jgi:hypothetical protein